MSLDILKKEFIPKFNKLGESKFYRFLLVYALNKLVLVEKEKYRGIMPHLEFLNYYDQFIILYRREGEESYLLLSKVFRKAAHRIYRIMIKKNMATYNTKFLNLV